MTKRRVNRVRVALALIIFAIFGFPGMAQVAFAMFT